MFVTVVDRVGDGRQPDSRLLEGWNPVGLNELVEIPAFNKLQRQVGASVGVSRVLYSNQVGVLKAGEDLLLTTTMI